VNTLADIAARKTLVLLIGEGGVGKTTCAAALAVRCACSGRRTAVLTIDPAPRLGTALGLERIDERPRTILLPEATAAGGSLHAFRLDTKSTFDRIVERLARRWFNGLRWYGLVATPREQVLTWLTESEGSVVQLRLADGMLGLEAEKPREDAGFGLVGPLMEAIAAFYAAPRDRRPELPPGAPRPAG